MIFRRVKAHIENENWFAVFIDFLIVVVGVFIGIQVANWNEAQSQRNDYKMALDRYAAEIDANISILRALDKKSSERISTVRKGFDTLLTCEDTPENRQIVNQGVRRIVGAYGVDIRMTSLRELTESPSLLAQQSTAERKILDDTRYKIDFLLSEAQYAEENPLEGNVVSNSMLGLSEREQEKFVFSKDASLAPQLRQLVMAVPLEVACKDEALLKAFYNWEYWQALIPDIAGAIQETLEESRMELKL